MKNYLVVASFWVALAISVVSPLTCIADEVVPASVYKDKVSNSPIMKKLDGIIIPIIDFEDNNLNEAIDFMRLRVLDLDVAEKNPANRGVNFIIRNSGVVEKNGDQVPAGSPLVEGWGSQRIKKLRLINVPASSALKYICIMTNAKLSIGELGFEVSPSVNGDLGVASEVDPRAKAKINKIIKEAIIPEIDFENISIEEAVDFISLKLLEMKPRKDLQFIMINKDAGHESPRIAELKVKNATIEALLREFCRQTSHSFHVHEHAIIISPVR